MPVCYRTLQTLISQCFDFQNGELNPIILHFQLAALLCWR